MEEIKEADNKETKVEKKQSKKIKICKVIFNDKINGILHVDFEGFGIQVNCKEEKDTVKIQYTSEIGKPDFTFTLVK